MDLMQRRNMLMRGGDSTDWKALYMSLIDGSLSGDVVVPYGVSKLKQQIFINCPNIESITIPDSVTSIESTACRIGPVCKWIDVGSGVTDIGSTAFYTNTGMTHIIFRSVTPPTLGSSALAATSNNLKIYVPDASVNDYKAASGWSSYANKIYPLSDLNT